ncbi:hypothetical protein J2R80_005128 [Bradyrhizobium sp. USDA 4541]|nr:hypothetical protein [Bradyrhizobium sp. USDA 4541]
MMGWAQRLMPRSVAAQLMSLFALSELIGITLAAVTIIFIRFSLDHRHAEVSCRAGRGDHAACAFHEDAGRRG